MKPLSAVTETFTESVIREMTRLSEAAQGINLSQGFPDFDPPEAVIAAAEKAIRTGRNQYSITYGETALRQAIARRQRDYNRIERDPATEITVTCGATEAMMATLRGLINPGDEIVVFEPFYENYGPDAILSGARPRFVTLRPPDWNFDPEELAAAFGPRTKALIINTPNNPTGKVFSLEEIKLIADLCLKWDCYLVTDEVYEHILYDGAVHVSPGSLPEVADRTVTVNSLSKSYSVTGWRVGWALAEARISARIRKVHDFLTVGAPKPFQDAGVVALGLPESYYQDLQARYVQARDFFFQVLVEAGFSPHKPKGAYYIMVEAAELARRLKTEDDYALAKRIIELTGVACVPGSSFYATKGLRTDQLRFCYAKSQATLDQVAERLKTLRSV